MKEKIKTEIEATNGTIEKLMGEHAETSKEVSALALAAAGGDTKAQKELPGKQAEISSLWAQIEAVTRKRDQLKLTLAEEERQQAIERLDAIDAEIRALENEKKETYGLMLQRFAEASSLYELCKGHDCGHLSLDALFPGAHRHTEKVEFKTRVIHLRNNSDSIPSFINRLREEQNQIKQRLEAM